MGHWLVPVALAPGFLVLGAAWVGSCESVGGSPYYTPNLVRWSRGQSPVVLARGCCSVASALCVAWTGVPWWLGDCTGGISILLATGVWFGPWWGPTPCGGLEVPATMHLVGDGLGWLTRGVDSIRGWCLLVGWADGPVEQWCRLGFRGLATQDAQRRVLGRDVVPLVGSRVGDMLGRLGLLAGWRNAWDIQGGLQPGQRCGRCCCWASGSMSPRQMGQGGMAGGVVAPGCVQSRSVRGSSSMGPPSSSVRWTTEVFRLVMLGGWGKSTRVGTRKSNDERWGYTGQRPGMQLSMAEWFFFFSFFDLFFFFLNFKSWILFPSGIFFRPVVTRLFLNWPASR